MTHDLGRNASAAIRSVRSQKGRPRWCVHDGAATDCLRSRTYQQSASVLRATRRRRPVAKCGILVGVAVAAIVVAGLAGCSSNKSNTTSPTSSPSAAGNQVIIDGQNQNVTGQVTCTPAGGNVNIGIGDATNGIGAVVTTADPPVVQAVGLGNLTGVTLGYSAGAPNQGTVQATKSGNSYTIKGTATGINTTSQPLSKPFEMDVTCP
jgi:ipoprotein LpqH